VLVIIKNASDLFRSWFIKPANNPPDHDRYATKEELKASKESAAKEVVRVEKRLEDWAGDVTNALNAHIHANQKAREDVERSLGRIEGKIDGLTKK
jgi:hypothetical protein